jgi:hypothetical protein
MVMTAARDLRALVGSLGCGWALIGTIDHRRVSRPPEPRFAVMQPAPQPVALSDSDKVRLWAASIGTISALRPAETFRIESRLVCISMEETECRPSGAVLPARTRKALRKLVGGCPPRGTVANVSIAVSTPIVRLDSATVLIQSFESVAGSDEGNEQIFHVRVPLRGGPNGLARVIYHGQVAVEPRGVSVARIDESCSPSRR